MCMQIRGTNDKVKWKIQLQLTRFDATKNAFCQHLGSFLNDSFMFCQEIEQATKSAVQFIGKEAAVGVPETQLEESQSESQTQRCAHVRLIDLHFCFVVLICSWFYGVVYSNSNS